MSIIVVTLEGDGLSDPVDNKDFILVIGLRNEFVMQDITGRGGDIS